MWIFLALLSSFCYATTNIIDKILVRQYGKSTDEEGMELLLMTGFANVLSVIALIFFVPLVFLGLPTLLPLCAGFFFVIAMLPYTYALHRHNVVYTMMILLTSMPIMSYFFGLFLFDEHFSFLKIALGLLALGSGILFVKVGDERQPVNKPFSLLLLSLLAGFFWTCAFVLFRLSINFYPYWQAMLWEYIGGFSITFVFLLIPSFRRDLKSLGSRLKLLPVNFVNEILGMVATFSLNAAIILAPLATVSLVTDIAQPIFVFLLSIVCFLLFPKLHVEDLTKSLIVKKFLIIVVVVTFLTLFLLA